jgi:chromosome segregation ATPase
MADARVDDWKRMSKTHEKQSQETAEKIKALEEKIAQLSRDAAHANQELHDIQARSHQREDLMQTQEEALKSAQERVTDLQQNNKKLEQQLGTVLSAIHTHTTSIIMMIMMISLRLQRLWKRNSSWPKSKRKSQCKRLKTMRR